MSCFTDEFLNDLVLNIHASTHIKDVSNGKYVDANKINSAIFNLTPSEVVGLNIWDLDALMKDNWDRTFIPQVVDLENQVTQNKTTAAHTKSFLTMSGVIRFQHMIKIPICGRKGNVQRIFTTSENLVSKLNLLKLWKLYKQFYQNDLKKGIEKFLFQTGVKHLFTQLPTEAELMVIILNVVHKQPGSKYIGQVLGTSPGTIDNHIAHLNDKLLKDKTLLFTNMNVIEEY